MNKWLPAEYECKQIGTFIKKVSLGIYHLINVRRVMYTPFKTFWKTDSASGIQVDHISKRKKFKIPKSYIFFLNYEYLLACTVLSCLYTEHYLFPGNVLQTCNSFMFRSSLFFLLEVSVGILTKLQKNISRYTKLYETVSDFVKISHLLWNFTKKKFRNLSHAICNYGFGSFGSKKFRILIWKFI